MNDDSNADPMVELEQELLRILHDCLMRGVIEDDVKVLCFSTGVKFSDVERYVQHIQRSKAA